MLNPYVMRELRNIADELIVTTTKSNPTFSDVIIFLIQEYRSSNSRSQQK